MRRIAPKLGDGSGDEMTAYLLQKGNPDCWDAYLNDRDGLHVMPWYYGENPPTARELCEMHKLLAQLKKEKG